MGANPSGRFQRLRTQIEAGAPAPALVLLTSARRNDGASISAVALADCLAAAGHRVALLCGSVELAARHGQQKLNLISLLSKELAERDRASDAVSALAEKMRAGYDYTVIDVPPLMESGAAMLLASAADAVLLTVRLGRVACVEDESIMEALRLAEARVIGVIGVSESTIERNGLSVSSESAKDERSGRPQNAGKPTSPLGAVR